MHQPEMEAIFLSDDCSESINDSNLKNTPSSITVVENHTPMVIGLVRSFRPKNKDERDNLMQAGYLGLLKANQIYKLGNAKFSSYAWVAIKNEVIKEFNRIRNKSYEMPKDVIDKKIYIKIYDYLPHDLSDKQISIINMKLEDKTFRQIANELNCSLGNIYGEWQKLINWAAKNSGSFGDL
jgi:RNA polymerase sigma factor (sigma-70 family)